MSEFKIIDTQEAFDAAIKERLDYRVDRSGDIQEITEN